MLTESQIAHFRTFGFVVLPNLFSENETLFDVDGLLVAAMMRPLPNF